MKYPRFLLPVLLPWLLFAIYQLFIAARLFEVESRFVVKQMQENVSPIEVGMGFLAGAPSSAMEDSALVQEYIASPNLMEILDEELDLRSHFEKFGADYLKHFDGATSKEKFLKRYRKMVKIKIEPETNVLVLSVLAYEPAVAQSIAELISAESEKFVNLVSSDMARDQVAFVQKEVLRSEERLRAIRQKLLEFQDAEKLLDPESFSNTAVGLISALQEKLVQARAEQIRLLSFMKKDAPEAIANQQQILSLEKQIAQEKSMLTGKGAEKLNRKVAQYKELQIEADFALEAYKAGFSSLEKARLDASRKLKHFVMVSTSGLPEDAAYPRILYNLLTALVLLFLLYGVIRLVIATIQDHRI